MVPEGALPAPELGLHSGHSWVGPGGKEVSTLQKLSLWPKSENDADDPSGESLWSSGQVTEPLLL